jgi:hypothetical protein
MTSPSKEDVKIARAVAERVMAGENVTPDEMAYMARTFHAFTVKPTAREIDAIVDRYALDQHSAEITVEHIFGGLS